MNKEKCMPYSHVWHLQILKNLSFRTWPFQSLNPTLTWCDQKTANNISILEDPTILIIGGIGFPSTMRPLTHRATKDSYVGSVERQHQDQWVLKDGRFHPQLAMSQILQVDLWMDTLQGTNISPQNGILKMIFLFPRWDMLIPWRVIFPTKKMEKMEMHGGSMHGLLMSSRLEKNPTTWGW